MSVKHIMFHGKGHPFDYTIGKHPGLSWFPVFTSNPYTVEGHETDQLDEVFMDCRTNSAHGAQDYDRRRNLRRG